MNETSTRLRKFRPRGISVCRWVFVVFLVSQFSAKALALDLRVETKVYKDSDTQPFQHRIALFDGKATYDLAAVDGGRVTILLRDQGMLILIDTIKKEYTRVSHLDLARLLELQQERIRKMSPDRQAVLNPSLTEEWNRQSKTLTLTNPRLTNPRFTYGARLVAELPEIVKRYGEFTDWHAQLNAIMPGSPSPLPRLALNKAIVTRGSVPLEVTKTHVVDSTISFRLRSEHRYETAWHNDDRRRVEQLVKSYPTYREVTLPEFLRVATTAKAHQR